MTLGPEGTTVQLLFQRSGGEKGDLPKGFYHKYRVELVRGFYHEEADRTLPKSGNKVCSITFYFFYSRANNRLSLAGSSVSDKQIF